MKRNPSKLAGMEFDLLVIGAGINGACIARDAAVRGLSVALTDRSDVASVTSSNSLRIIHGGLRYLQHLDLRRMRQSLRERSSWLRVAPHLVQPLPFMVATSGRGMRSRTAFRVALAVNDLIGIDRNFGLASSHRIGPGHVVSREEALRHYPGADADRITGGAMWHDAQMYNSERLIMSVLHDADAAGAHLANYVETTELMLSGRRIFGARVRDALTGESFEIRARLVVNASGPWVAELVSRTLGSGHGANDVGLSKAMNLLTRRIAGDVAVGVPSRHHDPSSAIKHGSRLLFITPWRDLSLIGTTHFMHKGAPDKFRVNECDVADFLTEINDACPSARLTLDDVRSVYAGLLPTKPPCPGVSDVRLLQHHRVIDHRLADSVDGLISVVGVKFTTARLVATQTVDRVFNKLGRTPPPRITADRPISGGDTGPFDSYATSQRKEWESVLGIATIDRLLRLHGTRWIEIIDLCGREAGGRIPDDAVRSAEVRHSVRHEMAVKLADVVFRRTDLAARGHPGDSVLTVTAAIMATELGWNAQRMSDELTETQASFRSWSPD